MPGNADYQGVDPHVRKLATGAGVQAPKVHANKSLRLLNSSLGQAIRLASKGDMKAARRSHEVSKSYVEELRVAYQAAWEIHREVGCILHPNLPPEEESSLFGAARAAYAEVDEVDEACGPPPEKVKPPGPDGGDPNPPPDIPIDGPTPDEPALDQPSVAEAMMDEGKLVDEPILAPAMLEADPPAPGPGRRRK